PGRRPVAAVANTGAALTEGLDMAVALPQGPGRAFSRARSYAFCERLTARAAGNFYHAFRLLPRAQRRGMCALYAFLRIADDLSDEAGTVDGKRHALNAWRGQLAAALDGVYHHPLHAALHDTVSRFHIPREHLEAVLDGV